jgi:phage shock protein E
LDIVGEHLMSDRGDFVMRYRQTILNRLTITLSLSFIVLASVPSPARSAEITKDSLQTVQKKVADKRAVLVDVREPSEWDEGHIEGAIFLPLSALRKDIDEKALANQLPKDKIVYTHCVVGKRAVSAANILEKLGYDVRPLKPGYRELVDAGFKKAADAEHRTDKGH